ncbi:hypothetical protein OpiT1DRAFT_02697 [Opitutaceae bacterium TAV1]|nr:hypothetical protein OpiT1DRAFT_02697 [Opitutaceae bacterium TAV1]
MHTQTVFRRHSLPLLPVIAASLLSALPVSASLVVDEGFNYANLTAFNNAGWSVVKTGNSFYFFDVGADRAGGGYNNQIKKSFYSANTAADSFTLTADIAMTAFSGGMYVLIASAPDTEGKIYGYAISWNGGTPTGTYAPNGAFAIGAVNGALESELTYGYGIAGTKAVLSSYVKTNTVITGTNANPAAVSDFGSVTLTWEKSTGSLNLYLGTDTSSPPALSIANTAYSSFANIYISGNGWTFVNNVTLDMTLTQVPEPRVCALLAGVVMGSLVLLRRYFGMRCH